VKIIEFPRAQFDEALAKVRETFPGCGVLIAIFDANDSSSPVHFMTTCNLATLRSHVVPVLAQHGQDLPPPDTTKH